MSTEATNAYEEQTENQDHIDKMLAKADALENAGQERPEWLPEKFSSAEEMALSYRELERKLSSGDTPNNPDKDEAQEGVEEPAPVSEEANDVANYLDGKGVDFNTLQDTYAETGSITEEDYASLEQAGLPKSVVDAWIVGQEAVAEQSVNSIMDTVGGRDAYNDMTSWASDNLSEMEIATFNKAIDSGDRDIQIMAIEGIQNKYQAVEGRQPNLMQGQAASQTGGGFASVAELTAAMSDPRYSKDTAYRQDVAARLSRSNILQSPNPMPPSWGLFYNYRKVRLLTNYLLPSTEDNLRERERG